MHRAHHRRDVDKLRGEMNADVAGRAVCHLLEIVFPPVILGQKVPVAAAHVLEAFACNKLVSTAAQEPNYAGSYCLGWRGSCGNPLGQWGSSRCSAPRRARCCARC